MIPILYSKAETVTQLVADQTNGLGRLADAITCKVQEDRNGAFTLSMTYPISGIHYADIVIGGCIKAKPNELADPQLFRIYHISKPLNGMVTIDAQHLSYDLSKAVVKPFSAKGITTVTSGMISNMIGGSGFSFSSDINNGDSQFTNDHPQSFRALLGGQEGSVLDVFGGEYEFNNEKVILHAHRGSDNGVVIRYGKNLTSVQQDENIESTYTAVYPYVLNSDQETIAGDLQTVVSTSEPKILALDLSSKFKEEDGTPTAAEINAKAQKYIKANNIGVPKVSLDVSFVQLWQTQEYKEIAPLERVSLCDTVTVKYEKLGVDAKAKVITTVYDVLAERYDSITLGDAKSTLASTIAAAPDREQIQKQASSDLERAVTRATNLITGTKGGHVVIQRDASGKPEELLIMDTDDVATASKVWRWNLGGLGYSNTGVNGKYGTAITQDGAIVADYITTGEINGLLIKGGTIAAGALDDDLSGKLSAAQATATGAANAAANAIISRTVEYVQTASTVAPSQSDSGWNHNLPAYETGKYIWERVKYVTNDGTIKYSDPVCDTAGVQVDISTLKQTFWADSTGAHVKSGSGGETVVQGDGVHIKVNGSEVAKYTATGGEITQMKVDNYLYIGAHRIEKCTMFNEVGTGFFWNG